MRNSRDIEWDETEETKTITEEITKQWTTQSSSKRTKKTKENKNKELNQLNLYIQI